MWIYDEQKSIYAKETWVYDEKKPVPINDTWVYKEKKSTPEEIRALKWDLLLASSNKDFYEMLIKQGIPEDQALDEALSI
jgi:hypothetical protein